MKLIYSLETTTYKMKHYFTRVRTRHVIMMIMFLFQFDNNVFAQQKSTGVPGKSDSLPSTAVNNSTKAPGDSLVNYSPAMYPGGAKAFTRYLMQNIVMPQYTSQNTKVTISVSFTVEESGKLKNFQASDGPNPLKKEAIRVVKNSGKWIPAYKDGNPIRSEQTQKITFISN